VSPDTSGKKGHGIRRPLEAPTGGFFAKDVGARQLDLRDLDVDPAKLSESSTLRQDYFNVLGQMERDQDTSLVFACEPGAPHSEAYRYFIMHVMREIGSRFAAKVSDALKLLEFLSPEAISTFVVYCNARRHNPSTQRVVGLHLRACVFKREPPTIDPSVDTLRILSVPDQKKLIFLLEVCREAASINLPVETAEDERKVYFVARAMGTTTERVLSDWGRVGMHGVRPQVQWAEALFGATFDWLLEKINQSWKLPNFQADPSDGCRLTFTKVPSTEGSDFTAFAYFLAAEALTQRVVEMLPNVQHVRGSRGREPDTEEFDFLRGTHFSSMAVGIFGEAGLLHFLTSGRRTENAITTYIELLRDGDLQMRRFFGARMRDILRLRARESTLVDYELSALAAATEFDNFEIFDLRGDTPKWCENSKVKANISPDKQREYKHVDCAFMPLHDVARVGRTTQIVRTVNGISQVLRVVRGDLVLIQVPTDREPRPGMATPSCVLLLERWRDVVPYRKIMGCFKEWGLFPQDRSGDDVDLTESDMAAVVMDILQTRKAQYEIVGDMVHFKPFMGRVLWDRINEELRLPSNMYWHSWDPDGDMKLPRRWRSPSRNKCHADYEASLPPSPPLRARGNRLQFYNSVKEIMSQTPEKLLPDKEMHGVYPDADLRFKNSPRDTHDESRLLFNTSVLMCSNELFSRGIARAYEADGYMKAAQAERAARARAALSQEEQDLLEASSPNKSSPNKYKRNHGRKLQAGEGGVPGDFQLEEPKGWSDNNSLSIDKTVIRKFDAIRAIFKGYSERKAMAELQRMHIAAQKIQLAYATFQARRVAGVQCLIRYFRMKKMKQFLMQMRVSKKQLAHEREYNNRAWRSNVRAPDAAGVVVLHVPGHIRRDQRSTIGKEICRICQSWCGVSHLEELIRIRRMDYDGDTTQLQLDVPRGVEDRLRVLQETMSMGDGPLIHVLKLLESQTKSARVPLTHTGSSPGLGAGDVRTKRAEKVVSYSASPVRKKGERAQSPSGTELGRAAAPLERRATAGSQSHSPSKRRSQVMDDSLRRTRISG
jgi:hypothetical protein